MGNQVGKITNRVTAMMEVQSRFPKDSEEYKILSYRIACGQLYQQDELDKIKGIIARPMPNYWYSSASCKDDDFLYSISIDKKPYFMTYVYDDYRRTYKKYIDDCNKKSLQTFGITLDELLCLKNKTKDQETFLMWYNKKMPFGIGRCAMNNICFYVENQFNGYKSKLKRDANFDYNILKVKRRCTEKHRQELYNLSQDYISLVAYYKNSQLKSWYSPIETIFSEEEVDLLQNRKYMHQLFYNKAKEICPDDNERLNIVLDMCYAYKNNKQFCWDIIGDLICKRLEEINEEYNLK